MFTFKRFLVLFFALVLITKTPPHLIAENLSYVLMVWFFICLFSPNKKSIFSNAALFMIWAFYSAILFSNSLGPYSYEDSKEMLILIDMSGGMVLSIFKKVDKSALSHSGTMAFAVLCHIMILSYLTTELSWLFPFYAFYDELLVLVALLQLWISYGSFHGTCSRILESSGSLYSRVAQYVGRTPVRSLYRSTNDNKTPRRREKT